MTAASGSPGTCGANYKADPPPIPRPRSTSDDPREPGRRADQQRRQP